MSEQDKVDQVNNAVAEGGAYNVIKQRLDTQTNEVKKKAEILNKLRIDEFGQVKFAVKGRSRVHTENACTPRDMVEVNGQLLFGYNVKIGMKANVDVADVLGLYTRKLSDDGSVELIKASYDGTFLSDPEFIKQFNELYRFYKNTQLTQLKVSKGFVLAAFQTGTKATDLRVFRWSIDPVTNSIKYVDDRGEEFIKPPASHDFKWVDTTRENHVNGEHPHVSILDKVFVECVGGDLTIKVEDNTSSGQGIYSEPVEEKNQSLSDGKISYADLGNLLILRITPYKEEKSRYIVFNTITKKAKRIDAIANSCVQLPEGHGIIFPGGYYLINGENKTVDGDTEGMTFKRTIKSPNGEDVLYAFHRVSDGLYSVLSYNVIEKKIKSPIYAHGYSLFSDGDLILFKASSDEDASRSHEVQIWSTSFVSEDFASKNNESESSFLGKLGNASIVRAISDLYSLSSDLKKLTPSVEVYEHFIKQITNIQDSYYWLSDDAVNDIFSDLSLVKGTSELVLDEFEKVVAIKKKSEESLDEAKITTKKILTKIGLNQRSVADDYVNDLHQLRKHRGKLLSIKDMRYMDVPAVDVFIKQVDALEHEVNEKLSKFLQDPAAFSPYGEQLDKILTSLESTTKVVEVDPLIKDVDTVSSSLELINEVISNLDVEDKTIVTDILDNVSALYSKLNQVRAKVTNKRKDFLRSEKSGQFASQFKLFSQNINNALSVSNTPDKCDEETTKVFNQLEELESEYAEFEDYLKKIVDKRDEVQDTFETHKQKLLNDIRKRCDNIYKTAERTLDSISRKIESFDDVDELNTYLSSDNLVIKSQKLIEQLRKENDTMRADDLLAKFKAIKDQSIRVLRDKSEIYEDGGRIMKMGKHKFSVHRSSPELTVVQQEENMTLHITGTEFFENVKSSELSELKKYWDSSLVSESTEIARAEYLAGKFLLELSSNSLELSLEQAIEMGPEMLLKEVAKYAAPRYQEAYDKGVHDNDAALILEKALSIYGKLGFLRYSSSIRAKSMLLVSLLNDFGLKSEIFTTVKLSDNTGNQKLLNNLIAKLKVRLNKNEDTKSLGLEEIDIEVACRLLSSKKWTVTQEAMDLSVKLENILLEDDYSEILPKSDSNFSLCNFYEYQQPVLSALAMTLVKDINESIANEAVSIVICKAMKIKDDFVKADTELKFEVSELLSDHRNIEAGKLTIFIDDWLARVKYQSDVVSPAMNRITKIKSNILEDSKEKLNINDFKANPLTSFVRNRLIMESYFPIIGDNLAKQIGTVGDSKRTDLMGMLLLISPPGYGKTTLIEYVANKLGLIFMKINCPSLGHEVVSLDPEQAPHTTAKKELEKLNLALEMGNNVMLYLDDIQHTDPEFLQKFISLCDGTRKIEGVWNGKTKTYDMRGKRFAVVMAGNPYTESGDTFKIPDMLANRADIYNLGDMLSGSEDVFASSYIENALTSNSVLAPLATRSLHDVYRFIQKAEGDDVQSTEFDFDYSAAESDEIVSVLQKMFVVRDAVMKANSAYVESAATADSFRIKPPFRLQGSYRNMAKMSEKIMSVMTTDEINQLIVDHYQGESQTLTTGAEENMLHLKELLGNLSEEEQQRWNDMLSQFSKAQKMGGKDADSLSKVAHTVSDLRDSVTEISSEMKKSNAHNQSTNLQDSINKHANVFSSLVEGLQQLKTELSPQIEVKVDNNQEGMLSIISELKDIVKIQNNEIQPDSSQESISALIKSFGRGLVRFETALSPLLESTGKNSVVMFNVWERLKEICVHLESLNKPN